MLGLNKREGRAFRLFFAGHLLLALLLVTLGFVPSCEDKPEEIYVFELASPLPIENRSSPIRSKPEKKVLPLPSAVTESKIKSKPAVNKSTPEKSQPTPKPKPKPKPKPNPPKAVSPSPQKKTVSKETVSFDQFRKKYNLPNPKNANPRPEIIPPKISLDPTSFKLPKFQISNSPDPTSSVSSAAVNQYLARVKAKLEKVWRSLLSEAQLNQGGEARLSFKISSSGTLVSAQLSKASGNASLDRLVLEVSRRVGNLGIPPGRQFSSVLEIPFRVN